MRKILQSIEEQAGRKMQTPKDFQWLSDEIFRRLHQTLSPSTLKRRLSGRLVGAKHKWMTV